MYREGRTGFRASRKENKLLFALAESGSYSPDKALLHTTMVSRDSAYCLLRATTSRRTPNSSSDEVHLVNTVLNQSYHRRVSSNRLNRKDSQLATG